MMHRLPNPYCAKTMIHDPEMFFGRADLLRSLYETVYGRQSISIVGPRSIGKSSFLWYASLPEAQALFPSFDLSRRLFVFIDLREYLRKTCEDFFHKVSKAIIDEGKKRGLTLREEGRGEDEFSGILDQIAEQGFFPVLLLDAFDKVTLNEHFDASFFEFLRSQANIGQVTYITASLAPLSEVCHSGIAGSPFFNIFYTYQMGALAAEEATALITAPAQRAGISLSHEEVAMVLRLAGRHPFFIQRICYLLFAQKQSGEKIDVKSLRDRAYKELHPIFEDIWAKLPADQRGRLQDEARQREHQQRTLPEFSESEIFRIFIRSICRTGFFSLTAAELEKALKKLDDLSTLGETNLRLMKVVARRLKGQSAPPTVAERGIAIRDVLNEALYSLRGSGMQSDSASDWKYYNILNNHYFKYHLKNENIAARLGVSVRQYYRERDKAVEKLLNALIEMEISADNLDADE